MSDYTTLYKIPVISTNVPSRYRNIRSFTVDNAFSEFTVASYDRYSRDNTRKCKYLYLRLNREWHPTAKHGRINSILYRVNQHKAGHFLRDPVTELSILEHPQAELFDLSGCEKSYLIEKARHSHEEANRFGFGIATSRGLLVDNVDDLTLALVMAP